LSLGVRRSIILWICNFLSNRRQSVKIDNSQSEWGFVNAGVPQGISTWTYSFINDLELTSPNTNHWKYVDDVTISEAVNRNEISTLQSYLDAIETWTKNNNMKLNGIKCKEMIIRFLHNKTAIPGLCINELSLKLVDSFKVLGVTINNKLKWQDNTVAIVKKAYLCYSCSATLCLPPSDLLLVYLSLVQSTLEYACPVWHTALPKYLSGKIEKVPSV
jgi:hypothetical protein